jgi:hypothetical protein
VLPRQVLEEEVAKAVIKEAPEEAINDLRIATAVRFLLSAFCYLLSAVRCVLSAVCCLPSTV